MIYIREFTEELKSRNISLKRDDLGLLLSKVKPNEMNQINYVEMSNYIMNNTSQKPLTHPTNYSNFNSNYNNTTGNLPNFFEAVQEKIKYLYQSQEISLKALFRQIDLDNDNYISFKEFKDLLERKLQFSSLNHEQIEACFKRFDDDQDYKISYFEFSRHILNTKAIDHKKLLQKLKKQLLHKIDEEKDLLKLFKSMDQDNNGFLSFKELSDALENFRLDFTKTEVEELFKYFDKEDKEKISYDHFIEVLSEDHLNLSPLRAKVQQILQDKGLNLKAYFRSLNSKGEDDFLKKQEFSDFLRKIGLRYDNEQEEELFEAFDADKDYLISFEEFSAVILDKKQGDVGFLLKKLRRFVFSNKLDLLAEFQALDFRRQGFLTFAQFSRTLKKCSELSPNEAEDLFKAFCDGEKRLDYERFFEVLLENKVDIHPIKAKFDELCERWSCDYEKLFEQFDQTGKGYLSWLDFDQMMLALQMRLPIEELQEFFAAFDLNKNGRLTKSEFLLVLQGKKTQNSKMFVDLHSPVWKRTEQTHGKSFNFDNFAKKPQGLSLRPVDFEEEEEEDSRFPLKKPQKSEFYARFDRAEEFRPAQFLEMLKAEVFRNNIDVFSSFVEFDHEKTCVLHNVKDLDTILRFRLGLRQVPESHIRSLFEYYSPNNGKSMNFIRLLMDFEDQGAVLAKVVKYVMRNQRVSLAEVLQNLDKDGDQAWNLREFAGLNEILNLGMEQEEIAKVFNQWDLNHNGLISIRELDKILSSNENSNRNPGDFANDRSFSQGKSQNISNFNNLQSNVHQSNGKLSLYQRKFQHLKLYLQYILQNIQEKNVRSVQSLCETNDETISRGKFLQSLAKIRVNVEKTEANELCSLLSLDSNPSLINLLEFEYLLRNFAEIFNENEYKGAFSQQESYENYEKFNENSKIANNNSNNINTIVQELKSIVEEEGFQMFTDHDRNATGFISERDLYAAFTKIIDPCEELDIFVRFISHNGRVSLEELKKVFGNSENPLQNFNNFNANSMGVKTNYQKAKILNNNEKKLLFDGMKELWRAFSVLYAK